MPWLPLLLYHRNVISKVEFMRSFTALSIFIVRRVPSRRTCAALRGTTTLCFSHGSRQSGLVLAVMYVLFALHVNTSYSHLRHDTLEPHAHFRLILTITVNLRSCNHRA